MVKKKNFKKFYQVFGIKPLKKENSLEFQTKEKYFLKQGLDISPEHIMIDEKNLGC